ncbi:hypothetical protein NEDG_00468 [Nematocida displodere]|uniref:Uncharacterized protein n=1 Tax=Nematocida displodere TaxID=1805483 RepID=A0A177EJ44_9MICR|nr:hypothetical protein NEDG_00468 [Nematocida displodere]
MDGERRHSWHNPERERRKRPESSRFSYSHPDRQPAEYRRRHQWTPQRHRYRHAVPPGAAATPQAPTPAPTPAPPTNQADSQATNQASAADTPQAPAPSFISVVAYIIAKEKVESEEIERVAGLSQKLNETVPYSIEEEIAYWEENQGLKTLGIEAEVIGSSLVSAETRSTLNEAPVPDILPNTVTAFVFNTKMISPKKAHLIANRVYIYKGESNLLRKAFGKRGKDFSAIQKEFFPYRTTKDLIHIYYHKKYTFRLKSWQGAYKDSRKIRDVDLKELIHQEWSTEEENTFITLLPDLGKKWAHYINDLPKKTEEDVKAYYKYYKRFLAVETKVPRIRGDREKKEGSGVEHWKAHERQTFALLFPQIGKSWGILANYIVTKNATEIRSYHRLYYKNLSTGEKILEAHLKDLGEAEVRTEPLSSPKLSGHAQPHAHTAGVLFTTNK